MGQAPVKIKQVPKVGNVEQMNNDVVEEEKLDTKEDKNVRKKSTKMKGNIAARFSHLNIDPSKLKMGAVPPKKVQKKNENKRQSIDQSVALSKAKIGKTKRKKKTRKKLNLDDDL